MFRPVLILAWGAAYCWASSPDEAIRRVENRYNSAKTLSVHFLETYNMLGRGRRPESGTLTLKKAGKMRWDYTEPAGKLFISDGKTIFLYTSADNRVERWKLKDTEDMRAPLAFLLGHMDMKKEFKDFQVREADGREWLMAAAKNAKTPYESIEMLLTAGSEIKELKIRGRDGSLLDYQFDGERLNIPVGDAQFVFRIPENAQVVDSISATGQGM